MLEEKWTIRHSSRHDQPAQRSQTLIRSSFQIESLKLNPELKFFAHRPENFDDWVSIPSPPPEARAKNGRVA